MGFWTKTPQGNTAHISGDPNMSNKELSALSTLIDEAIGIYQTRKANEMKLSPSQIKILEFIKQNGPVAILAWTDYTPGTITEALAALLESGVIVEVERGGVVMVEVSDNEN